MEHILNPDLDKIQWEQLTKIFQKVGWGDRNANDIEKAFKKSSYTYFVFDADNIVGFGRTMDDGKYYALIADVIIDPNYQGKGLGKMIVNSLKDQLKNYLFITLTSTIGNENFYKKMGWKEQILSFIWPQNDWQRKEYCKNN